MARTKIVIEVESDECFVHASGAALVQYVRDIIRAFKAAKPSAEVDFNIVHDGKNVTEVIQ